MANIITSCRILCSIILLLFPVFSKEFYILYLLAGFTDMIDGTVARKTGKASDFGAKFDTVADFVFIVACLIKIIPVLNISIWVYVWVAIIALIKVINVVSGLVKQKKFVTMHTIMNKITGIVLFIFPLTLQFIDLKFSAIVVCAIATFAAIQEGHYIRTNKDGKRDDGVMNPLRG